MFTISQAAERTGESADTLRAWERRYAIPTTERSAGGYRLYDEAALAEIRTMRGLIKRGWPPRNAAEVMRGTRQSTGSPEAVIERMVTGELSMSELALMVEIVTDSDTPERAFDQWLMPMLGALGESWVAGRATIDQEHATAQVVIRRLGLLYDRFAPGPRAPTVLAASPTGSRHELGLLMFTVAARRRGVNAIWFGAEMPTSGWFTAVARQRPAAMVTVVPMPHDIPAVRETLIALREAFPRLRRYVGGANQDAVADLATGLGHSFVDSAARLREDLLAPAEPARSGS